MRTVPSVYREMCDAIYAIETALDHPDTPAAMLDTLVDCRDRMIDIRKGFRLAVAAS